MSISLIAFGNLSDEDTIKIKHPFRYIDKGDTLTVFRLQDERAIAYKIKQGQDCQENIVLADSVIRSADLVIAGKNKEINTLIQQKQNLTEQVATKTQIEETYKGEIKEKNHQIKRLKANGILYKITTGILLLSTTYFLIN